MSNSDYFTTTDPEELKPAVFEKHCYLKFYKELYCTYSGYCEIKRVINTELICLMCEHRKLLDLPAIIKKQLGE
jgi:hypothetical protein